MKYLFQFLLTIFGLCSAKIFIARSCATFKSTLNVAVKVATTNAYEAYEASGENGKTARTPGDDEIARLIFGTEGNIGDAGERLRKIGELEFDPKDEMVDDMVKGPPGDIWIYCDLSRFDIEKDGYRYDTRNGHKLRKDFYDQAHANQKVRLLAFTANFVDGEGHKLSVTSVNFVSWYMNFIEGRRFHNLAVIADKSEMAKKMVNQVAKMPPKFWTDLDAENVKSGIIVPPAAPIDGFRMLLDSVLLHEFGHSKAADLGEDTDGDESYGWGNVVKLKKPDNCDSLLMFAITITIQDVDHGGYKTREDGWLYLPLNGF